MLSVPSRLGREDAAGHCLFRVDAGSVPSRLGMEDVADHCLFRVDEGSVPRTVDSASHEQADFSGARADLAEQAKESGGESLFWRLNNKQGYKA